MYVCFSVSTPWYEAYRECFMQVAYPSDHEFLKHFLACILFKYSTTSFGRNSFTRIIKRAEKRNISVTVKNISQKQLYSPTCRFAFTNPAYMRGCISWCWAIHCDDGRNIHNIIISVTVFQSLKIINLFGICKSNQL